MEEFVNCFEDYEISNFGNCRKKLKNGGYKDILGSVNNCGYRYLQVQRDGKRINKLFHHLVAKAFLGDRQDNLIVDHIDRNKLNNNVNNLRYTTQTENMRNTDRYLNHIEETDPKARALIRSKEYAVKNRDIVLQKKREYYQKMKEEFKKRRQDDKVSYVCERCQNEITIQRNTLKLKKDKICYSCHSRENLLKINKK